MRKSAAKALRVPGLSATRKENGQGLVEFALMLPFLLVLVFGIIEFGRLLFFYSSVTTSAREAARYGSAAGNYSDCTGIRAAAKRVGILAGIQDSNILISYDDGTGTTLTGGANCPPSNVKLGNRIIVYIKNVKFQPLLPLVNVPPINLSSKVRRTILINLQVK